MDTVYPANHIGGVDFAAALDPDTGNSGVPYVWDYTNELGNGTIASANATVDANLTQVGNVTVGSYSETTRQFTASSGNTSVQVVLTVAAGASAGRRYPVTVVATDDSGYEHHRTGYVKVAHR